MLTEKDLKFIGERLTDIKIEFMGCEGTAFCLPSMFVEFPYINLDFVELSNFPVSVKLSKGHNVEEFYLIGLLHEICHYRQYKRFFNGEEANRYYENNGGKMEKVADRYARRYYKKVLKSYQNILQPIGV